MSVQPPPPDLAHREPVRVTYVVVGFIQACVTVLLATEVFSDRVAAIVVGITTAAYVAVSELFTRSEVVPLEPLQQLAPSSPLPSPNNATTINVVPPPAEPQSDT